MDKSREILLQKMKQFTALAFSGFNGEHCENDINECGPNPCFHDGQCIDLIGAFQCNCTGTGNDDHIEIQTRD